MPNRKQFMAGLKAGIPVVMGFIPVSIAYAIMAQQVGFSFAEIVTMSLVVFAGASQMMAVGMVAQGAGMVAIILATFILNLRHLIMSVCVFNRAKGGRLIHKMLGAFGVTDESFAIFTTEIEANSSLYFFLGLVLSTYSSWVVGSAIGALAASLLPAILSASLGIALYAMFLGLLIPSIKHNLRLALLVIMTAVINTLLSQWIVPSWSLIIATLFCAGVGIFFVDLPSDKEESA